MTENIPHYSLAFQKNLMNPQHYRGSSYNLLRFIEKHALQRIRNTDRVNIFTRSARSSSYSHDNLYTNLLHIRQENMVKSLTQQVARYLPQWGGRCNTISFGKVQASQNKAFLNAYAELAP